MEAPEADIKVSQKQVHEPVDEIGIPTVWLSLTLFLVESYHGNIRDRAGQKSKVKKERLVVNITVTNRELPGSREDDRCVTATL